MQIKLNIKYIESNTALEENIKKFLLEWHSSDSRILVQTSGSTGTPKKIWIQKKHMRASAQSTINFLKLKSNDSALLCLPLDYISGKMMMARAIVQNLQLIVTEPSLSPMKNINFEIGFAAMTPLQVEKSLDKIHLIKKLIIGGAAVSENLKNKILAQFSIENNNSEKNEQKKYTNVIYETYGMSETVSHIALRQIFPEKDPYFKVLPGVSISQDERGCLIVSAKHLDIQNLQTNDIIHCISKDSFEFLGRADNIINSGGVKISPEQIEKKIKKILPNELIILGVPDESLGQKLALIIEGKEDKHIREKLLSIDFEKPYFYPKMIFFIDNIPKTPNNKVDRKSTMERIINTIKNSPIK